MGKYRLYAKARIMSLRFFYLITVFCALTGTVWAQPCTLPFSASVTSPLPTCTGRSVQFSSTFIPGATYSWTGPGFTGPVTVPNPTIASVPFSANGNYTVTATFGSCVYTATVKLDVKLTPSILPITYKGPKCPGENDTLVGSAQGGVGLTYYWYGPNGFTYNSTSNEAYLNSVKQSDKGIYHLYAISTEGCVTDTVNKQIDVNPDVTADFSFSVFEYCGKYDSIKIKDNSTSDNNQHSGRWDFGDKTGILFVPITQTNKDVDHYYPNNPIVNNDTTFEIFFVADNGFCKDSLKKQVTLGHPIKADFTVNDDSICQGTVINIFDKSRIKVTTSGTYYWTFGDTTGVVDSISGATLSTHKYDLAGIYKLKMRLKDYLGCLDSAEHEIVVDSSGAVSFRMSEDAICAGGFITFTGDYSPIGNTNAIWNFGDGTIKTNAGTVVHAYDKPGVYTVTFKAKYRICPDTTFTNTVRVKPFPLIDLGPDQTICPNGNPLSLADRINAGNPNAKWIWNTEIKDKGSSIVVKYPGIYSATVDIDGCAATDSVTVTKNCNINIPNAFTPNGDGTDDYFLPRELLARGLTKFSMKIFNRWGGIVFETNSTTGRGWDGSLNGAAQPMGTYIYLIEASFLNGNTERYQGNITLLR